MRKTIFSLLTFTVLCFVIIGERIHHKPSSVLTWDNFGYYLYLPALFIYQDLGIENRGVYEDLIEKYNASGSFYQVTETEDGKQVMRYPVGWSILYSPFFFIGHGVAVFTDFKVDGFSPPYQFAIGYGSLLFAIIGLFFFRKFLQRFFTDKLVAVLLGLVVLGTDYLHMTSMGSVHPHNHIFALFAIFCWLTAKWHQKPLKKYGFLIGLIGGLMMVTRPTAVLTFLIPLLWGVSSFQDFKSKLLELFTLYKHHIVSLILGVLLPGMIQMLYWKIYSGSILFYSYQDPGVGFDFLNPHTLKFLFSFRKGWFIYTPLALLFISGFLCYQKRPHQKGLLIPILVYLLIHLYITSSWTCWWFAGADYSQRVMLKTYVVLAIPMGWLLEFILRKKKWLIFSSFFILFALTALNVFQTWQFHQGIIHHSRMTRDYYFKIFGKTYVKPEWRDLLLIDRSFGEKDKIPEALRDKGQVIAAFDFENGKQVNDSSLLNADSSGNRWLLMKADKKYSPTIELPFHQITDNYYAWLKTQVTIKPVKTIKEKVYLVTHLSHEGGAYKYRTKALNEAKKGETIRISMPYLTPHIRSRQDPLKVFVWNPNGQKFQIDNLKVRKYE